MIRTAAILALTLLAGQAFAQATPERTNPFEPPTTAERERQEAEARMAETMRQIAIRQSEDMRRNIITQIQEEAKTAAAKQEADALAKRGAVSGPGAFAGPLKPGEKPRAPIARVASSGNVMAVDPTGPTGLEAVIPDNFKHVSCINGKALFTDGKATFELQTGQSRGLCAR